MDMDTGHRYDRRDMSNPKKIGNRDIGIAMKIHVFMHVIYLIYIKTFNY